jgi:hypothetical protein
MKTISSFDAARIFKTGILAQNTFQLIIKRNIFIFYNFQT